MQLVGLVFGNISLSNTYILPVMLCRLKSVVEYILGKGLQFEPRWKTAHSVTARGMPEEIHGRGHGTNKKQLLMSTHGLFTFVIHANNTHCNPHLWLIPTGPIGHRLPALLPFAQKVAEPAPRCGVADSPGQGV